MKEYFGASSQSYTQANGNLIILNPHIEKILKGLASKGAKNILDVGCGNGFFSEISRELELNYLGVDVSTDMVSLAKKNYPNENFLVSDGQVLSGIPDRSQNIVLCSMLIPAIENDSIVLKILQSLERVVTINGHIVIATAHPCFDPFMQSILGKRSDVKIYSRNDEPTYFDEPISYDVSKKMSDSTFTFKDNHRTFSRWYSMLSSTNHKVIEFNECKPSEENQNLDYDYFARKKFYPTFLITVTQSQKSIDLQGSTK